MAMRVIFAALISAILMFFWGFVFWGPVLNMTAKLMSPLAEDVELDVIAPLRGAQTPDGMYVYPGPLKGQGDKAAEEAWTKKVEAGPLVRLAYRKQGFSPTDPTLYAKGFGHSFLIALLSAGLLAMVVHALPSYASRVGVLLLVSLIAALWTNLSDVIWWFHTPQYAAGQIVYTVVSGLLMALATAAIVKPRAQVAAG
jgi:hypothetical protein